MRQRTADNRRRPSPPARCGLALGLRLIAVLASASEVRAAAVYISPGQSVQQAIDRSSDGDVIILRDGVYHETLRVTRSVTLRAEHPGEATITNRHNGRVAWRETSPGSRTWSARKAPHRPSWPEELDRRWGGLDE